MNIIETKNAVLGGKFDNAFTSLYGKDCDLCAVKNRYIATIDGFSDTYGEHFDEVSLFSVSGRSEIGGNHTDHNCGKVLAASISLDIIAVAAKTCGSVIRLKSEGFPEDVVSILDVETVRDDEKNRASALIRGMCDGFKKNGRTIGTFCAYTTSNVLKGSGLSSSAAFEDMVGNILNHFYNDGSIDNVEIAKIARYSENVHFGKPCGLMDQMACAVGGFIAIDFKDPSSPIVEKLSFDLEKEGLSLCIVNTGGNHADLTDDYASVPADMKAVAKMLGKNVLREASLEELLEKTGEIRSSLGDRALMRSMHFYKENQRVDLMRDALKNGDIAQFLAIVKASGISSFTMLQNVYTTKNVNEQGLSLALAISSSILEDDGAYRVHGGGFAGTVQCYVPNDKKEIFRSTLDGIFGEGSVYILNVRPYGAVCLDKI